MRKRIKNITTEELNEKLADYSDRQIVAEVVDMLPKKLLRLLVTRLKKAYGY